MPHYYFISLLNRRLALRYLPAIVLFFFFQIGYAQNLSWVRHAGGTSLDYAYALAADPQGNVYITGFFQGTSDLDPGNDSLKFTSRGIEDIFIIKLDASGNLSWAKSFGGSSSDYGYGIAVDDSGNVYTAGYFQGTSDFDPGADTFSLVSTGNRDIFISKLDASGNFKWARKMGSSSFDESYAIAVDDSGYVYTTGYFSGTADFDPGSDTFHLVSSGNFEAFVSKLDASGNFVWAKKMGGPGADVGRAIAVDSLGNVYTSGVFRSTGDFDPGSDTFNLSNSGGDDIFISKLDAAGNFVWAKSIGSAANEYVYSLALDAGGNVHTTGHFAGTVDFDPGNGTFNLSSAGDLDVFISKLNTSGSFAWAKNMGGVNFDEGKAIATDASGNVYTGGAFESSADFDPGSNTFILNSAGSSDIFISKLDSSGNFNWAVQLGGPDLDYTYALAVVSKSVYSTGFFHQTADFDPGSGTFNLSSKGFTDIFIHKMDQLPLTIHKAGDEKADFMVYPNPAYGHIAIDLRKQYRNTEIRIADITGKELITIAAENRSVTTLDISHFIPGVYILSIRLDAKTDHRKIIVKR